MSEREQMLEQALERLIGQTTELAEALEAENYPKTAAKLRGEIERAAHGLLAAGGGELEGAG